MSENYFIKIKQLLSIQENVIKKFILYAINQENKFELISEIYDAVAFAEHNFIKNEELENNIFLWEADEDTDKLILEYVEDKKNDNNNNHSSEENLIIDIDASTRNEIVERTREINNIIAEPLENNKISSNQMEKILDKMTFFNSFLYNTREKILFKELEIDPLSGAYNRKSLEQKLNIERARAKRSNFDTYIIMLDLDHFKKVNDNYGHQTGDEVIKTFAHTISQKIRETDLFFRYGGEEFLLVLTNIKYEDVKNKIESILDDVRDLKIFTGSEHIRVTSSAGACLLNTNSPVLESVQIADGALYMSKESGRNQCTYL